MAEVYSRTQEQSASPFAIRSIWTSACARVILIGELDLCGVETMDGCVDALLSASPRADRVILDVHELRFVDVVGLRALVRACWRLGRTGPLEVLGIQPPVQRILDLANLTLSPGPDSCDGALTGPGRPERSRLTGV